MNEETLFELARNTPPDDRAAMLDRECAGNEALRTRIEALLAADAGLRSPIDPAGRTGEGLFLRAGNGNAADMPTRDAGRNQIEIPGTLIVGRYKLIENLGEGGMGTVWIAEQKEPVKRKVAIKLIKAGMDSKQVLARFDAERQALALMDHPNIAKVFDGGMTETGRPFFVMEYVKGVPFTEYCDAARLSLKERLELFIPVCQAVQHAHHKGIVHRDLKPSNILICLYDGKPVPKVIDFGLAKALHQQLTDQSLHTAHGMMVGTPLYMSPEQAEYNNLDVDTRTDIYSLGVVLYQLLTGSTPLEREQLRKAAANEVLRLIREVEPPKPSTRLSGSASLPSIAAQRNIDPRSLQRSLTGDLDWIVMKSLDKERTRRYETVNGFARDIERFLQEEPVEACPPSTFYRLKKYLRKHKPQVIAAGVILSALLISVAALSWGLHRSNEAAATVRQSLADVTDALDEKNAALTAEAAQRAKTERELINGILRPIGYGDKLDAAELRAFIDWSQLADSQIKLRVIEVALDDPETALRLARRADRAIQACVGINPKYRRLVLELLYTKQKSLTSDPRVLTAATTLSIATGSNDLPNIAKALDFVSENVNSVDEIEQFGALCSLLTNKSAILSPDQLRLCTDKFIAFLGRHHNKIRNNVPLGCIRKWVDATAFSMSGDQIMRLWHECIMVISHNTHYPTQYAAKDILLSLVPSLPNGQLDECLFELFAVLNNANTTSYRDEEKRWLLYEILAGLSVRLQPTQVNQIWDLLISTCETRGGDEYTTAGNELVVVAPSVPQDTIDETVRNVVKVTTDSPGSNKALALTNAIVAASPRLDAAQVELVADSFLSVLENSKHADAIYAASLGLTAIVSRIPFKKKRLVFERIASWLESDAEKEYRVLDRIYPVLAQTLDGVSTDELQRIWQQLTEEYQRNDDQDHLEAIEHVLSAIALRMPTQGKRERFEQAMKFVRKPERWRLSYRRDGQLRLYAPVNEETKIGVGILPDMAMEVDAAVAEKYADDLLTLLNEETSGITYLQAAAAIGNLIPHLPAHDVSRAMEAVFKRLTDTPDENTYRAAARMLSTGKMQIGAEQTERFRSAILDSHANLDCRFLGSRFREFIPCFGRVEISRAASTIILRLLDHMATTPHYFDNEEGFIYSEQLDFSSFRLPLGYIDNQIVLAELLMHPACVDRPREWMLQRFEELVFHNGERVFLPLPSEDDELVSSAQPAPSPPPRKFHTVHDAAAWIEKNWPDFDLEATMPVTWRNER